MTQRLSIVVVATILATVSIPSAMPVDADTPILDDVLCFGTYSRVITETELIPAAESPDDSKSGVMAVDSLGAYGVFIFVDGADGFAYDFTGVIKEYVRCEGYKPTQRFDIHSPV